jgi:hypothetical protein
MKKFKDIKGSTHTKVEPPKTIEDFEKVLETIDEFLINPYMHHEAFSRLLTKRGNVVKMIEQLKEQQP